MKIIIKSAASAMALADVHSIEIDAAGDIRAQLENGKMLLTDEKMMEDDDAEHQ